MTAARRGSAKRDAGRRGAAAGTGLTVSAIGRRGPPARSGDGDGGEELRADVDAPCAVVRGALEAGVSPAVVVEELQREVERRLMRSARFYDEAEW